MNDEGLACGIIAGDAFYPASPGAAAWIASACTPPVARSFPLRRKERGAAIFRKR
jgi:hypothetical protein